MKNNKMFALGSITDDNGYRECRICKKQYPINIPSIHVSWHLWKYHYKAFIEGIKNTYMDEFTPKMKRNNTLEEVIKVAISALKQYERTANLENN